MTLKIKTTYVGPTDTRGSAIKASFNGKTLSMRYEYSLRTEELHAEAAKRFAEKHGLTVENEPCDDHHRGYFFKITGGY